MRTCTVCGQPIPQERLDALPDAQTCVRHSREKPKVGFMVSNFAKGTASALVMVDPTNKEALRQANRANRRRR